MTKPVANTDKTAPQRGPSAQGAGGARLAEAFEAVTRLPALAESRRRLLRLTESDTTSAAELAETVESDAAVAIAVMREANNGDGPSARIGGIQEAVDTISPAGLRVLAGTLDTYDALESGASPVSYERFRRHALAVRHASDRVAGAAGIGQRDELAVAALLHDIGKLVLAHLHGEDYGRALRSEQPEERLRMERRELGIDHALVGAVLVRRWGLRPGIAAAIERHHSSDADGHAAVIGLADAIVHHAEGDPVPVPVLLEGAQLLDLGPDELRSLLYEFPHAGTSRPRSSEPCPLTLRELESLRGLAEGKVYKQIAQELGLSVSTIRTHLHNVYRKIGAVDRAQAVLIARDRGWL